MERPHSFGSGFTLKELYCMVAKQARIDGVKHRPIEEELALSCVENALEDGMKIHQIAAMMGYSTESIRNFIRKIAERKKTLANGADAGALAPAPEISQEEVIYLLQMKLLPDDKLTPKKVVRTIEENFKAFYPDHECPKIEVASLMKEARELFTVKVVDKVVNKVGKQVVIWTRTNKTFRWKKPETLEERTAKADRCLRILLRMMEKDAVSRTVHLGHHGLQHVLNHIVHPDESNPKNPLAPSALPKLNEVIDQCQEASNKRLKKTRKKQADPTLLVLLTASSQNPPAEDTHMEKIGWAIARYASNQAEICFLRSRLDADGIKAFVRQWKKIKQSFEEQLDKAVLISSSEIDKRAYTVCLGFATPKSKSKP